MSESVLGKNNSVQNKEECAIVTTGLSMNSLRVCVCVCVCIFLAECLSKISLLINVYIINND